jgi:hypothetical protein
MKYKDAKLVKIVSSATKDLWYNFYIGNEYWVTSVSPNDVLAYNCFDYVTLEYDDTVKDCVERSYLHAEDVEVIKTSDIEITEEIKYTLTEYAPKEYPSNKRYFIMGVDKINNVIMLERTNSEEHAKELVKSYGLSNEKKIKNHIQTGLVEVFYITAGDGYF